MPRLDCSLCVAAAVRAEDVARPGMRDAHETAGEVAVDQPTVLRGARYNRESRLRSRGTTVVFEGQTILLVRRARPVWPGVAGCAVLGYAR